MTTKILEVRDSSDTSERGSFFFQGNLNGIEIHYDNHPKGTVYIYVMTLKGYRFTTG